MRCTFTPEFRESLADLFGSHAVRFKSGLWRGSYRQYGSDHPQALDVTFDSGVMIGTGGDGIGIFLIAGRYDEEAGDARWLKHYIGRHTVSYSGSLVGTTISGTWTLVTPLERLTGAFSLAYVVNDTKSRE